MNSGTLFFTILSSLIVSSVMAQATVSPVNPTDLATITNNEGKARVLFNLPVTALPANCRVERATLVVALGGPAVEKNLMLQIHPITTPWNAANVSWDAGWNTPGGDVDAELYTRVEIDLSEGDATIGIDLTHLMKEILEEGLAAYGFLVTVPPYLGEGFDSEDLDWLSNLSSGSLDLVSRVYPAPPPSIDNDVRTE